MVSERMLFRFPPHDSASDSLKACAGVEGKRSCALAPQKLKIDDPVGAWPVHGLCGVWGGIATGIFGDRPDGIASVSSCDTVRFIATLTVCAWSFITSLSLLFALQTIGTLRVSPQEEQAGWDISEHGRHAYPLDAIGGGAIA
jgi:Amt family ammonium transporter